MLQCYTDSILHLIAQSDLSFWCPEVYTLPNSNHWEWSSAKTKCICGTLALRLLLRLVSYRISLCDFNSVEHLLHCSILICISAECNINCAVIYEGTYFESLIDLFVHWSKCSDRRSVENLIPESQDEFRLVAS